MQPMFIVYYDMIILYNKEKLVEEK